MSDGTFRRRRCVKESTTHSIKRRRRKEAKKAFTARNCLKGKQKGVNDGLHNQTITSGEEAKQNNEKGQFNCLSKINDISCISRIYFFSPVLHPTLT